MNKRQRGSVLAEFIVVALFGSLVAYFALVGDPADPGSISVVNEMRNKQVTFAEKVLAP